MEEKGTIIDSENFSDDPATNLERFIKKITKKVGSEANFNALKSLLIETGAVIAGGSVVNSIINYSINDIDVYVPCKNITVFNNGIQKIIYTTKRLRNNGVCDITEASKYCRSFLRRNGIRRIYSFKSIEVSGHTQYNYIKPLFDVMSVRNKRAITDVVTNFDLTFCQVWYDGTNIRASHPDHIRDRVGYMQEDYVPLFISGNYFLINRVKKYTRNFKVKLSINVDTITLDNDFSMCKPPINKDDEHYKSWYRSEFLYYIFNNKKHQSYSGYPGSGISSGNSQKFRKNKDSNFMLNDDYDSDDYDNDEKLNKVAITKRMPQLQIKYKDNPQLKVAHVRRDFIFMLHEWAIVKELDEGKYINFNNYINWCINNTIRKGRCVITLNDNVTLWDLHKHDLDQGISEEGLAEYLEDHISDDDKLLKGELNIKCYSEGCQERLNTEEISIIIKDTALIDKLKVDKSISVKIDTSIHETTLQNTKSIDQGFGLIYHYTMCPFCLAQEVRDEGCLYMTHKYDSKLLAPYCQKYNIIPDIINKYTQLPEAQGRLNTKYQFCSECGRACWEHKHIKLDASGLESYVKVSPDDTPFNKCSGGGRAELFARMLAVRKVLTEQTFDDDFEQRKACALAADIAPLDPVLMARANEILAKSPETRTNQNLLTFTPMQGGKTRRRINRKASRKASKP